MKVLEIPFVLLRLPSGARGRSFRLRRIRRPLRFGFRRIPIGRWLDGIDDLDGMAEHRLKSRPNRRRAPPFDPLARKGMAHGKLEPAVPQTDGLRRRNEARIRHRGELMDEESESFLPCALCREGFVVFE